MERGAVVVSVAGRSLRRLAQRSGSLGGTGGIVVAAQAEISGVFVLDNGRTRRTGTREQYQHNRGRVIAGAHVFSYM